MRKMFNIVSLVWGLIALFATPNIGNKALALLVVVYATKALVKSVDFSKMFSKVASLKIVTVAKAATSAAKAELNKDEK